MCFAAQHCVVEDQEWKAGVHWGQHCGPDGQRVGVLTGHPCMSASVLLCAVPFHAGPFPAWVQWHQFHLHQAQSAELLASESLAYGPACWLRLPIR